MENILLFYSQKASVKNETSMASADDHALKMKRLSLKIAEKAVCKSFFAPWKYALSL